MPTSVVSHEQFAFTHVTVNPPAEPGGPVELVFLNQLADMDGPITVKTTHIDVGSLEGIGNLLLENAASEKARAQPAIVPATLGDVPGVAAAAAKLVIPR